MMPWTRHGLVRGHLINSTRECYVHVEALMNALERALKREDQGAIAAAREVIKQSALKIEVSETEYRIQVLQPALDPTMAKIGAHNLANAPLGITGELDRWSMPINAYVYMGDRGAMPWDVIVPWWGRRARRERERAASVARSYASCFQPEFIKARSDAASAD
jgi:hypothetical protein